MYFMEELKEILCKELEEYAQKDKLSAGDLETIHKLTDTIKNIGKIEMLDGEGGYSEDDGGWMNRGGGMMGQGYDDRGSSYARGGRGRGRNAKRDNMGRYAREGGGSSYEGGRGSQQGGGQHGGSRYSRAGRGEYRYSYDGYSREGAKEYMMEQLEEMMDEVETPKEKEAIRRCMQTLQSA